MWNKDHVLRGIPVDHGMAQVYYIEDAFTQYFQSAITPQRIIELGTFTGHFGNMVYRLRSAIDDKFNYFSFDIKEKPDVLDSRIIFQQLNCFENIDYIGNLILENTLVLCDNGNKIDEVRSLTPYLKKNCVIMAHDYFKDMDTFWKENCWPVCEIQWHDVVDLGLEPYFADIMNNALWLSLIKRW